MQGQSIYKFLDHYISIMQEPVDDAYDEKLAKFQSSFKEYDNTEFDQAFFYSISTQIKEDFILRLVCTQ